MSYDYVGDLSETVALMWPAPAAPRRRGAVPSLSEVVTTLATLGKAELPAKLAAWLDALDETGRWALLKLVTGALRIGVSARLAKTAVAALGGRDARRGRAGVAVAHPALCRPVRLARRPRRRGRRAATPRRSARRCCPTPSRKPISQALDPADFVAEWKWDGIRVQAAAGRLADGRRIARLYSRTGEDISGALSRSRRGARFRRRARRRAADHARRPRAVLQRAAAAAQPQDRLAEAAGGLPGPSARLRPPGRGRQRPARRALRSAARAARGLRRAARLAAHRPLSAGAVRELGRARRGARRSRPRRGRRRCRGGRGRDDQASATRPICRAGRRACGGSGSAIPS